MMLQWFKEPKIDFMKPRRFFLGLSALGCLAGIYAIFLLYQGKANLGTDFGAGVMLRLSSQKAVDLDPIRQTLKGEGYPEAQIQQIKDDSSGNAFKLIIKIKHDPSKGVGSIGQEIIDLFNKNFPEAHFTMDGSDEVGPAVSQKLRDDATKAFMIAMFGILLYIAWRFDFRFGVAAIITTFHDILVILGFVILTGREFNLLQVTALLTLAGYSLNDTVVNFDRIRENMRLLLKDQNFEGLVNLSINETLSRTINTSLTVFLTLLPLCVMGGDTLKDFAVTLLAGVIVGTYSSVFVASPILVEWNILSGPKKKD